MLIELNDRIHAGIRSNEEKARKLIRDFPGRIDLEAMFITLVGMWGFAHPGTLDEHLSWLRDVMAQDTNKVRDEVREEFARASNIVMLNRK